MVSSFTDGYIPVPIELFNLIGIEIKPVSPDGRMSVSTACDVLAEATKELTDRLSVFPEIQKQINSLSEQVIAAEETKKAKERGETTKEVDVTEQRELLAKIRPRVVPLIASTSPLVMAIGQFSGFIRDHLTLLSEHLESGDQRILLDVLTAADTELTTLIWNSKRFAKLEAFEKWQLPLPHTNEHFLEYARVCTQLMQPEQVPTQTLEKAPGKFSPLPKEVVVPLACLRAVQTNWSGEAIEPDTETTFGRVKTDELAKLTVKLTKRVNNKFLIKGVWAIEEGQNKYSDLTRLMEPLIEAYIQSFPADQQTMEEYQALTSLHYYCLLFSDALQSNAHTDRADILKKEIKKHSHALDRLSGKQPK